MKKNKLYGIICREVYFLTFLYISTVSANDGRVKLDEKLGVFLGTLERYTSLPNDVVFLLDESGSIGSDKFPEVKKFAEMTMQRLSVSPEHSRIAIVTFATDPRTHVNHIKYSQGNNMCTILKLIDGIDYVAQWTHTHEAMVEAGKILSEGRANSNKIIILITDGESNDGHKPYDIANQLKKDGVIIFAVGVAKVNVEEINLVASSLNHTYILQNFSYIVEINKYLVSDMVEVAWDTVENSSLCNSCIGKIDCCDNNAHCYCGTRSGKHECACNPGYEGNGNRGECKMCPKGTYKSKPGKTCIPCRKHSTTANEGRTSEGDCFCETGYERNGTDCVPVKCASLSPPDGGVLIPSECGNTFGSICEFKCREGHCPYSCNVKNPSHDTSKLLTDPSFLPIRKCLESGQWTGEEFHCEKIKCSALDYPSSGKHNCSNMDFSYGTTCSFSCDKGYELHGSTSRSCLLNGSWTGSETKCTEILCDPLKTNEYLKVKPKYCGVNRMPFRSTCQYHCIKHFNLTSHPSGTDGINHCQADGNWSGVNYEITCRDISPPVITCPKSIVVNTDPGKPTAVVTWDMPTAADNVYLFSVQIKEPHGIRKPPHAFPINDTKITYEATDDAGLSSSCSFRIKVTDKEPPRVVYCPSDIEVYSDMKTHVVKWADPVFEDNSGRLNAPIPNRKSGDEFSWGPPANVFYNVSDTSGNTASCKFTVKVKPYPCPYYDPPANGLLTCDTWLDGRLCSVYCNDGYDFASSQKVPNLYQCFPAQGGKSEGRWMPFATSGIHANFKMPWPDCSKIQKRSAVNVTVNMKYGVDHCSEEEMEKMKRKFIETLMLPKKHIRKMLCPSDTSCIPENVNVTCAENQVKHVSKRGLLFSSNMSTNSAYNEISGRKSRIRRGATESTLSVSYNIKIYPNASEEESFEHSEGESATSEMLQLYQPALKDIEQQVTQNLKELYNGPIISEPDVLYNATLICTIGQLRINNSCVNCPAGTYKDELNEMCTACPQATYQDKEKSLSCLPCPEGYTTYQSKSKSSTDCKAPCKPGSYSKTTFEPCLACLKDTYQEHPRRKECLKCPAGLYTWKVGCNSSSDCVSPCKPGSYSDTGLEPCNLCDIGTFQEKENKKSCVLCPNGTTTHGIGSVTSTQCKESDMCEERKPCHSLSTCIQLENDYKCICPNGLYGRHCEIDIDSCKENPCLNNGTCTDLVGNYTCSCPKGWAGHQCEVNVDDCQKEPCLNGGKCIDLVNGYECQCAPGYTGQNCEVNIFECFSHPCLNGGTCFDMQNGYRCCCPEGYGGSNCNQALKELDVCDRVACKNGGTCISYGNDFNCSCPMGFSGELCEINIDDCVNYVCHNGGMCVDGLGNATCLCPGRFSGNYCEEELFPEFALSFMDRSTSNYVALENKRLMYAVTVSFFMRSSFKDPKSRATPISYSYSDNGRIVDNALTLLDINRIVLYLHGEMLHTGYVANSDSDWHHFAVTWEKKDGKWAFFVDANAIVSGSDVGQDKYMWPGIFILGQEQDSLGGAFSSTEAFEGDITEFNVWDYAMSAEEIKLISTSCGFIGNVIPWFTASKWIHGNIRAERVVDLCGGLGTCSKNVCSCFYANEEVGNDCKFFDENCNKASCANKQLCATEGDNSHCNCGPGFEGRYCEYDVNECFVNNGGCSYFCVNDIGSYHCSCPEDMFLAENGLTCLDTKFCKVNESIYLDGETWLSSCESCSCIQGHVQCYKFQCNETTCHPEQELVWMPGECCPKCISWSFCAASFRNDASSLSRIMKFDLTHYEFSGACSYILAEDCVSGLYKVEFESRKYQSLENKLVIFYKCVKISITSSGFVYENDVSFQLPFQTEGIRVELVNTTIDVRIESGLFVQWHITNEVIVAVPVENVNQVCGMCGNLNEINSMSSTEKYFFPERVISDGQNCYIIRNIIEDNPDKARSSVVTSTLVEGLFIPVITFLLLKFQAL